MWAVAAALAALVALQVALTAPSVADEGQAQKAMVRGMDALARGDATAALAEFQQAQTLAPGAPVPHRYAGKALEALGRWAEAITSYQTYLRIRPTSKDATEIRTRIDDIRNKHLEGIVDEPSPR